MDFRNVHELKFKSIIRSKLLRPTLVDYLTNVAFTLN